MASWPRSPRAGTVDPHQGSVPAVAPAASSRDLADERCTDLVCGYRTSTSLARRSPLRPELERYDVWEREAKRRGLAVSALAMQLMDEASGWRG